MFSANLHGLMSRYIIPEVCDWKFGMKYKECQRILLTAQSIKILGNFMRRFWIKPSIIDYVGCATLIDHIKILGNVMVLKKDWWKS